MGVEARRDAIEAGRPCPLCGRPLPRGAPMEVLERHFQTCSKTDDRLAPRREWRKGEDSIGPDVGPSHRPSRPRPRRS